MIYKLDTLMIKIGWSNNMQSYVLPLKSSHVMGPCRFGIHEIKNSTKTATAHDPMMFGYKVMKKSKRGWYPPLDLESTVALVCSSLGTF